MGIGRTRPWSELRGKILNGGNIRIPDGMTKEAMEVLWAKADALFAKEAGDRFDALTFAMGMATSLPGGYMDAASPTVWFKRTQEMNRVINPPYGCCKGCGAQLFRVGNQYECPCCGFEEGM